MARRPRRNHSPSFKAKAAVSAIKGEKTLIELAQEFDVHPRGVQLGHNELQTGLKCGGKLRAQRRMMLNKSMSINPDTPAAASQWEVQHGSNLSVNYRI